MHDDKISNPRSASAVTFETLCERRYSRRIFIKSGVALGVLVSGSACTDSKQKERVFYPPPVGKGYIGGSFNFVEIAHGIDADHHVAPDHQVSVLLRWGDPITAGAPEFDFDNQSPEKQLQQFGYNCDYVGYLALAPEPGQQDRALLCVNHEYPNANLMFPRAQSANISEQEIKITQAAVGNSIIEIEKRDDQWRVVTGSNYNRRLSALDTEFEMSGPAAGHPRLRTSADNSGKKVIGTLNNCAGGMTPWGTYLSCEENFNYHFAGQVDNDHIESRNHRRYNLAYDLFKWGKFDKRFNLRSEPNEPNRFGWVVEIDPLDPTSTPKKRTALGRFKHEGGETVIAPTGQLVVYMGDDQRFEYLYKFVSRDSVNSDDAAANKDLLDQGVLYVAKFADDGSLRWLALQHDDPRLSSHFASQADVLIETREAADQLGATPMDRPEDVVPNRETGKVYVMLTNNSNRKSANVANPRVRNVFGHIIEIHEDQNNFAGTTATWNYLVKCGDPSKPEHAAQWNNATSENGWFANPDNGVLDPSGRLWVSTDGSSSLSGTADGLWAMETDQPLRGTGRMFYRAPTGAEVCGPIFDQTGESLFLAIQHPGETDQLGGANVDNAETRWPDFDDSLPPKPSLVVVSRRGGGKIA